MGAHKSPGKWQVFWTWVCSEPELTFQLLFLVASVLLAISVIVSVVLLPAILGA